MLAKLGNHNNKPVTLNLIYSIALPILTYSLEALALNKSELISINHPWVRSFEKMFNTFDKYVVKQCQLFNGYVDVTNYYSTKSMSFFNKLKSSPNILVRLIYNYAGHEDLYKLASLLKCSVDVFSMNYKNIIRNDFDGSDN